jgi:UDP-GlcNAc:undecaprenyl-phosphate GlcNAc-1-phosphate transferase
MNWPVELFIAIAAMVAAMISLVSLYLVRRFAQRMGLIDKPGHRKVHTVPTPLGGGIGIWLGVTGVFAIGTAAVYVLRQSPTLRGAIPGDLAIHLDGLWSRADRAWVLLGAASSMAVLGLIDDLRGLPWQVRLGCEFLVAALTVFVLGYRLTAFIPFPPVTGALSVLWIVAMINAFNMLDNMDALSGGVAAIIACVLGVVMLATPEPGNGQPQLFVAALLFIVVGALAGFLWHNRPPARIFMGDAGSYFVGFLIAVATLLSTYAGFQENRPHAMLAPLCVMAVPLYDMSTVLWIRIREGRSPFEGDKRHFSHRLVALGLSKPQAVMTIFLLTLTCGLAALLLGRVDSWGAGLLFGIVVCTLGLIFILESTGWSRDDS